MLVMVVVRSVSHEYEGAESYGPCLGVLPVRLASM